MNKHIEHIDNYDIEVKYYNKKPFNKKNYHYFCNDTFNFRKNEIISNSQQTYITRNIIETNTQTTKYIDENYLNNNEIATVILNPTPSLNENYLRIPETSDNVVPGLDSLTTYTQSKHAILTALQNSITNINNTIQTEINNLETNNQENVIANKELYYHKNYTDYTIQRNNTIHKYDNRRTFTIQNHFFTYQRKGNQELQIQLLNNTVADLQNQINNITTNNPPDNDEPETGTM